MDNIEMTRSNTGKSFIRQRVEFPSKMTSRVILVGNREGHLKMKQKEYVPLRNGDIVVDLFRFKGDFTIKIFQFLKTEKGEDELEEIKETEDMQHIISIAKKISEK
ncbi:MAG: hypothetical protein ACI4VO_02950 [Clostridia bacterium]